MSTRLGDFSFSVELARTEAERARGLMFRHSLPRGHGMLFVFDEDASHPFWMKNTYVSLDILFIARDGAVLGCVARTEPLSEKTVSVPGLSRFVLEVPAGFCDEVGVGSVSTSGAHVSGSGF